MHSQTPGVSFDEYNQQKTYGSSFAGLHPVREAGVRRGAHLRPLERVTAVQGNQKPLIYNEVNEKKVYRNGVEVGVSAGPTRPTQTVYSAPPTGPIIGCEKPPGMGPIGGAGSGRPKQRGKQSAGKVMTGRKKSTAKGQSGAVFSGNHTPSTHPKWFVYPNWSANSIPSANTSPSAHSNWFGHQGWAAYPDSSGYPNPPGYQNVSGHQNTPGYLDTRGYQNMPGYQNTQCYSYPPGTGPTGTGVTGFENPMIYSNTTYPNVIYPNVADQNATNQNAAHAGDTYANVTGPNTADAGVTDPSTAQLSVMHPNPTPDGSASSDLYGPTFDLHLGPDSFSMPDVAKALENIRFPQNKSKKQINGGINKRSRTNKPHTLTSTTNIVQDPTVKARYYFDRKLNCWRVEVLMRETKSGKGGWYWYRDWDLHADDMTEDCKAQQMKLKVLRDLVEKERQEKAAADADKETYQNPVFKSIPIYRGLTKYAPEDAERIKEHIDYYLPRLEEFFACVDTIDVEDHILNGVREALEPIRDQKEGERIKALIDYYLPRVEEFYANMDLNENDFRIVREAIEAEKYRKDNPGKFNVSDDPLDPLGLGISSNPTDVDKDKPANSAVPAPTNLLD